MVGTLASSDQDIDAGVTTLSNIALQTAATQTQLTWIIDGYTLVLACLLLPAGTMGDRFGRRGALLVGPAIFAIASLSPTLFDSPAQIIVARAIAGVGAAFIMPATLSLLTAAVPKSERNKAVGVWAGVASSGAIFGFMGTGLLLKFFSWQSIFYGFAAAALGLFVCTCTIASSRDETATPLDWIGAVLIGGAVAVFMFGVVEAPVHGWTNPIVWGCMSAGVLFAGVFAVVELRRKHPLLRDRVRRHHVPVLRQLRILFRFNAVHAVDPGLQPATDGVCSHAVGDTDHGSRRDHASLSSPGGSADSGSARLVPDRGRAVLHAHP